MKDACLADRLKDIVIGIETNNFLTMTATGEWKDVPKVPQTWFIIKPTKKKLGKDYKDYLGIRFIYNHYVEDTVGGYMYHEQVLNKEDWSFSKPFMDKYVNIIVNKCRIKKKLVYTEGDKRIIYEVFVKKDEILPLFGLFRIEGLIS